MIQDPYKVLGIGKDASKEEVKKAYRSMAKKYHPDLHPDDPGATERMNEINEAYDMIMNPEKYRNQNQANANNPYNNPHGPHNGPDSNPYNHSENRQEGYWGPFGWYGNQSGNYNNQNSEEYKKAYEEYEKGFQKYSQGMSQCCYGFCALQCCLNYFSLFCGPYR